MGSFRVRPAISQALHGRTLFDILQRLLWKSVLVVKGYVGFSVSGEPWTSPTSSTR